MAYYALRNLNHNNVDYAAGEEVVDLTDEQAAPLVEFGAVSTENPETAGEIVEPGVTPAATLPQQHPDFREGLAPSEIPHPVPAEQERIAAEQASLAASLQPAEPLTPEQQAAADEAAAQAAADEAARVEAERVAAEEAAKAAAAGNDTPPAPGATVPVQVKVEKLK